MSSSPIDLSKFSPERLALRKRLRKESEAASARAKETGARDRAAHEALKARDRAAAAVRIGEARLERDRAELRAAEREFDRAFPGSECVCFRCGSERTERSRAGR